MSAPVVVHTRGPAENQYGRSMVETTIWSPLVVDDAPSQYDGTLSLIIPDGMFMDQQAMSLQPLGMPGELLIPPVDPISLPVWAVLANSHNPPPIALTEVNEPDDTPPHIRRPPPVPTIAMVEQ